MQESLARLAHLRSCGWFWGGQSLDRPPHLAPCPLGPILLVPVAAVSALMASHLNPVPWLVIGIASCVGGIVAHARRS
jgi:hypothetical protein